MWCQLEPVISSDFPEISRDLGNSRDLMTSQKLRIGSKVKVKPTQVKVKVKYANEGRHLGILRHPWPLIG